LDVKIPALVIFCKKQGDILTEKFQRRKNDFLKMGGRCFSGRRRFQIHKALGEKIIRFRLL